MGEHQRKRKEILQLTHDLRSVSSYLSGIVRQLNDRGIHQQCTVLISYYSDDPGMEVFLIVTHSKLVIEFEYHWGKKNHSDGSVKDWNDISNSWGNHFLYDDIEIAIELIDEEIERST